MLYQHILVAVDLNPDAAKVALRATALARLYRAKLSFVLVEPGIGDASLEEIELGLDLSGRILPRRRQALDQLIQQHVDYPVSSCWVMTGEINRQVAKVVASTQADLLVVGKHMDRRWLASHTGQDLAMSVQCDMLLVTLKTL